MNEKHSVKIALLDLNHSTRGVHNNTAPLGLAAITRYLTKTVNRGFEARMFKDIDKVFKALRSWKPDILGIAQYSWNSELNLCVAGWIKENNPNCLVVAGGPNLDLSEAGRINFFKSYACVDLCVSYDGEIPFSMIVKRFLGGESIGSLKKQPTAGTYAYDAAKGLIIDSCEAPPRLGSLDVLGSLYADKMLDEFLEDGYHPFLQTHRGCPFTCTFCHTSDRYYSRMLFLSPEIFRRDMEYLGKRFSGRHDVTLYLANTNMSLFKEDFVIAEIIRQMQKKYDWPRIISVNFGKDPKKLFKMLSLIRFNPAIALQTLTPQVLKNIKRVNIPLKDFVSFQDNVLRKTNETTETELILCLPGETKASFLKTVRKVINSGVQSICIYTLMHLKGTPLFSQEYIKKFGYVIRHRVVPRQFSVIQGKKILDSEEVIVGTNTMSFGDYLELRGLCFTIAAFFSSTELIPLKKLLIEYGVDLSKWVFGIQRRLSEFPDINQHYCRFMQETKLELFPTKEALFEFFAEPKHWEALCAGYYGDNLLRKYKQIVLSCNYQTMLELALSEAKKLLNASFTKEKLSLLLKDMKTYLSTRDVKNIFIDNAIIADRKVRLSYNIPLWLSNFDSSLRLGHFYGASNYLVAFGRSIREKAKEFIAMNKDGELSLQILYRDGNIKDFWPQWAAVKDY